MVVFIFSVLEEKTPFWYNLAQGIKIVSLSWNLAPAIIFRIFWGILIFYQIYLSPQVKRCAIITYKHGIYESPQELPNELRLRILGDGKISGKCLNSIEWYPSAQSPCQNENFINTSKTLLKNRN